MALTGPNINRRLGRRYENLWPRSRRGELHTAQFGVFDTDCITLPLETRANGLAPAQGVSAVVFFDYLPQ